MCSEFLWFQMVSGRVPPLLRKESTQNKQHLDKEMPALRKESTQNKQHLDKEMPALRKESTQNKQHFDKKCQH